MRDNKTILRAVALPVILVVASADLVAETPAGSVPEIAIPDPEDYTVALSKVRIESAVRDNSRRSVCLGDVDDNGRVDFSDFVAFAAAFGAASGDANYNGLMDLDGNGRVDFPDFLAFAALFGGPCKSPRVAIPDSNLRAVIADSLGIAHDAPITRADVETLFTLLAVGRNIRDLTGIEFAINLESLVLGGNEITGSIPPELGSMTNLKILWLEGNALTGPIPPELGSMTNLILLMLNNNALTGPIPPELGQLTNLRDLFIAGNALTGSIPPELGNLTNLIGLNLENNALTGPIPPELGNLTNLERLSLSNNQLAGPLPGSFTSLVNLSVLDIGDTGLCAPSTSAFRNWIQGIETWTGVVYCTDR